MKKKRLRIIARTRNLTYSKPHEDCYMVDYNVWIAKMAFTPFSSLSLPWRSIVIRLSIDVGRKRKEVSGWVMDQDDWSTVAHFSDGSWHTTAASLMTNGRLKNPLNLEAVKVVFCPLINLVEKLLAIIIYVTCSIGRTGSYFVLLAFRLKAKASAATQVVLHAALRLIVDREGTMVGTAPPTIESMGIRRVAGLIVGVCYRFGLICT